jgi:hypothetical protein
MLGHQQVASGGDGQKLGDSFDHTEDNDSKPNGHRA